MVVCFREAPAASDYPSVATILVSRQPFSDEDVSRVLALCKEKHFDVMLTPDSKADPRLAWTVAGDHELELSRRLPVKLNPATDDCPYFFYLLRPEMLFSPPSQSLGTEALNTRAPAILADLLIVVVLLSSLCVALPLALSKKRICPAYAGPFAVYFLSIGLAYIFVEISQLESLIIFLGHPTYSLSVVLFTLLISSGLGSLVTAKFNADCRTIKCCLGLLLITLALFIAGAPYIVQANAAASTSARILIAGGLLFPLGLAMGMAFPLGFRLSANHCPQLGPWLWAVNGAASVCGSVLALVVAINFGISQCLLIALFFYLIALLSLAFLPRKGNQESAAQSILAEAAPTSEPKE